MAADQAAADRGPHARGSMSLLGCALVLLALLGVALPVVYWRKIRIRHL